MPPAVAMVLAVVVVAEIAWAAFVLAGSDDLRPHAVPAVVATLMWGFLYGTRYGVLASVNNAFGTNIDFFTPSTIWIGIGINSGVSLHA